MANIKITDLTAYTDPLNTDVLPIVDVTSDTTKKVSIADLLENAGSGSASAPGIAFDGDSNTGIYRPGADQLALATNGTGRLFIDASGRVGVGTASPSRDLTVSDATNPIISVQNSGQSTEGVFNAPSGGIINLGTVGTTDLTLSTVGVERLRITSDGKLGVGDNAPLAQLSIKNASGTTGFYMTRATSTSFGDVVSARIILDSAGPRIYGYGDALKFWTAAVDGAASEKVRITSDGKLGVGTSSPATDLHIASSGAPTVTLSGGSTSFKPVITFGDSSERSSIQGGYAAGGGGYLLFRTDTTGGTSLNRLYIGNDGNVGIGTTSPNHILTLNTDSGACFAETAAAGYTAGTNSVYYGQDTAGEGYFWNRGNNDLLLGTNNTERARIDSSGRLLVGTSSALTGGGTQFGKFVLLGNSSGANSSGIVVIGRNAAATSLVAGNTVGEIYFGDTAAAHFASISCAADASTGSGDYPGRLVFSTTADGDPSPTEAWRINNQGSLIKTNSTSSEAIADNVTTTILTVGSGNAIVHFDVMFIDGAYRQGVWAGQYTLFVSDAAGAPAVSYYLKEHWQDAGSSNWSAPVVTVAVDSSGNVTLNATNSHSDMNGNAYVYITAITGGNPTITTYT